MTLNHNIPYKKPILKAMPVFVNARGVIQDLEQNHGGLYFLKSSIVGEATQDKKPHKPSPLMKMLPNTFVKDAMKRIHSAKPQVRRLSHGVLMSKHSARP